MPKRKKDRICPFCGGKMRMTKKIDLILMRVWMHGILVCKKCRSFAVRRSR